MKKLPLTMLLILAIATSPAHGMLVKSGATSVITYFVFRDRTNGNVDTGVTIANLEMYYIEDQAAISGDVFVGAHGAATDAYTTGECYNCGWGVYRFDWPDGAFDGGIGKRVQLIVIDGDGGAFTEIMEVELSAPVDSVLVNSATPLTAANITDDWESQSNTDPTGFHVNLEEINGVVTQLEMLMDATSGVAVDADMSGVVVNNSVLAHMMEEGADTTNYDATTDSLGVSSPSAATIANSVWDEVLTGLTHNDATSAGRRLREVEDTAHIYSGGIASSTATTIVFDAGPIITNGYYDYQTVIIIAGTGIGQSRLIDDWVGGTLTATVHPDWIINPAADSEAAIRADVAVEVHHISATAAAQINAEVDTALNTAIPGSPTADSINERIKTLDDSTIPSAASVADAIMDEAVSDHQTSGTLGWYIRRILKRIGL